MKIKNRNCKLCNKKIISDYNKPKTWCSQKCKNTYNNNNRKSTKRTKQVECKTCGSLSLNIYCNKNCYPQRKTWQSHARLKKGYNSQLRIIKMRLENKDLY